MILEVKDFHLFIWLWLHLQCFIKLGSSYPWNLFGKPGDGYYIAVNIGFPIQKFNLLIDTGSSNLAIGGASYPGLNSFYDPSKSTTFKLNGTSVKVLYTQGWWEGYMGQDFVQIPSLDYVQHALTDLAIITEAHGFYVNNSNWQGILGLAYSEIAKPQGYATSWFDSLSEELPNITNHRFDLKLCGPSKYPERGQHFGRFSIGNFKSACSKSRHSTLIEHRWYYEVLITGFKIGEKDIEIPCSDFNTPKTIVDSGTSNLQISPKAYYAIVSELRRQTENHFQLNEEYWNDRLDDLFWEGKKEICFSKFEEEWKFFPPLTIFLNHDEEKHFGIKIPSKAYLRPALNRTNQNCWLLGIEMAEIGTVLGTVVLEGLCLAFDRKKGIIYISESDCGPAVSVTSIQNKTDGRPCNYTIHVVNGPLIASSIILALVLIPLGVAFVRWIWVEFLRPKMASGIPFISLDETNT